MKVEKVEIPLFSVVSDDPLQKKLDMKSLEQKNEAARNELETLLADGYKVETSVVYVIPPANQVWVVLLSKNDGKPVSFYEATVKKNDELRRLYLQPVEDDNR